MMSRTDTKPTVHDHGFSVVWPQSDEAHLVDIVIIHGLQGHPLKTWLYKVPTGSGTPSKDKPARRSITKLFSRKKTTTKGAVEEQIPAPSTSSLDPPDKLETYWPTDLLPVQCPQARIMVWGYDTMVTRGYGQAANKSGIFTHAQNLLYSLSRERTRRKPIIFVAHSLGGILAKEMISYADASREDEFLEIVQDISAVVFLGTPHRGSGAAQIGEIARRVASALRIDTSPAILDSLGLRNDDLIRSQQSFARIWDERRFGVKTFQESTGLSGVNVGILNDLIVPIESSTLGHPKEHPESLDADHLSMCKFKGCDDPNYRKFGAEMKKLYESATNSGRGGGLQIVQSPLHDQCETPAVPVSVLINPASDKALLTLSYRNMGLRERTIERPASKTCDWPLCHPDYQAWLTRSNVGEHRGLLRLMGHPGSGKSVLVKALAGACATHAKRPETQVAAFFFDACGNSHQKSMLGFLKTILFQLLPTCAKTYNYFNKLHDLEADQDNEDNGVNWQVGDLRDVFLRFCSVRRTAPIYIFIDAVDECGNVEDDGTASRSFADFLQDLADASHDNKSNVNICVSSRWYPTVTIRYCAEIFVDIKNRQDIELYVSGELQQYGFVPSEMHKIKDSLTSKAEGVFLWARLVLSSVAQAFDAGMSLDLSSFLSYLAELPKPLHELFGRILKKFSSQERVHALRLFQWAILAQRPLSADEWIHILAFVVEPDLHSIKAWREGRYGVRNMEQLAKRLRNMTGGLLKLELVSQDISQEDNQSEVVSVMRPISLASIDSARAGSMEPHGPATFVVQFMHLSACQYFLTGNGFESLGQAAPPACFGAGHIYIAATCLRYAQLDEVQPLIGEFNARRSVLKFLESSPARRVTRRRNGSDTNLSVVSFGSSAASSVRSSLPASAPSSISGNAKPDEFSEIHSQLTRELLENHTHAAEDRPEDEPEEYAHYQSEQLENLRPESTVINSFGSFSEESIGSWILDDPALRLYAVEMFLHHVVAADEVHEDPSELLNMLHSGQPSEVVNGCWFKWCQLNGDIQPDATPPYFAALRNLRTWIEWYSKSPSYQHILGRTGGRMRYPLLAAIFWGHDAIVVSLTDHVNADHVNAERHMADPCGLLHYLAVNKVKADTTPSRLRFIHDLIEELLSLSAILQSSEGLDTGSSIRFRSYLVRHAVDVDDFERMLFRIQALSSPVELLPRTEPQDENTPQLFLDNLLVLLSRPRKGEDMAPLFLDDLAGFSAPNPGSQLNVQS